MAEGSIIVKGSVDCWFEEFKHYLDENTIEFPIPDEDQFNSILYTWAFSTKEGLVAVNSKKIGFVNEKPAYLEFFGLSDVKLRDPAFIKKPIIK